MDWCDQGRLVWASRSLKMNLRGKTDCSGGCRSRRGLTFRKAWRSRFASHPPRLHRSRKKARTCIEGPFGEVLRATGPMAAANPFRFSSKFQDDETRLLYYGYRYYDPSTGRWNSRDPIGERGGPILWVFTRNRPTLEVDFLGLRGLSEEGGFGMGDFEWEEPDVYPHPLDEKGPRGISDWVRFRPEATVESIDGCCYGVRLSGGSAKTYIVYIPGSIFGQDVLAHELNHVRLNFKPAYTDYKARASDLGRPCMSKVRAMCIRDVIVNELAKEYNTRAFLDGYNSDWNGYGGYLQDSSPLWELIQTTWNLYWNQNAATANALAACPRN
jgi:RHS repeat-associated protein